MVIKVLYKKECNMSLETELNEDINKNLPAQVGDALKSRLEL